MKLENEKVSIFWYVLGRKAFKIYLNIKKVICDLLNTYRKGQHEQA